MPTARSSSRVTPEKNWVRYASSVTVDTVKKHFKQIHKKTGTRGQAELFAKYFTANLSKKDAFDG